MSNAFYRQGLIGGGADDLDLVDGADVVQDDVALVLVGDVSYFYKLEAASGAAEASPGIISPDSNAGTKR
jgi:hypothetical protein